MKSILRISTLCLSLMVSTVISAQEFNFEVRVTSPAASISDEKIFEALENQIYEFYNNTTWTDDSYSEHERIKGNIQLTIKEEAVQGVFKAELVIQTSRPVYNSNVSTPIMRYVDKNISFVYDGLQPIRATTDGYIDNFSSVLSFFAYYILGMDYDSFSPMGGDAHFDRAFGIYNALPSSLQRGDGGWTPDDKRQQNRYFLIENIRAPKFRRFREAMYTYHRKGMDLMYNDFKGGRESVLQAITDVGRVNKEINNTILPQMFADTKRIEIVDIFIVADPEAKTKVRSVMLSIDPSQTIAYRDLR